MENKPCLFLPLLILLLNNTRAAILFNSAATDKQALISFKTSLEPNYPSAALSKNWSHNAPVCNWIGVSCGIKHLRVTALNLSGFGLVGTVSPFLGNLTFLRHLDISFNNFTGLLPLHLSNLRRLKVMNVAINSFGGEIPTWLGSLPQLEQLSLDNNSFSGGIPPALFNNSKLQMLTLTSNLLSGDIPMEIGNISSSFSSLEILSLDNNQLSGSIPRAIFDLYSMRLLSLSINQLSGEIPPPNTWKCRDIKILSLSNNYLSGNIPSGIGSLSMLRELHLGKNHFRGEIPADIGNLSRLEILSIHDVSLSGSIPSSFYNISSLARLVLANTSLSGRLPSDMCNNLPNINVLYLYQNELEGQIPSNIGKCRQLEFLDLSLNNLSGNIPHEIGNLTMLMEFYMWSNALSGSLPTDMGNSLPYLKWVQLRENRLNGEIPRSINNASQIEVFDVSHNSLTGSIPDFGGLKLLRILQLGHNNLIGAESATKELTFLSSLTQCPRLEYLVLWYNPLNGVLPASIGNFSFLLYFDAQSSNITGSIPSEIGNMSSLLYLYLSDNQVSGHIPPTIRGLKKLQKIYLGGNQLVGSIPNDVCELENLGELGLGANMLTGAIPNCLGDVRSLKILDLSFNQLNSTIPLRFWNLEDLLVLNLSLNWFGGQLSSQLTRFRVINSLDLSWNLFSGNIPSTIDGCESLETLILTSNKFTGSIPESLGKIPGLRKLDLSNNSFTGFIPMSLSNLKSLEHFNVSYNELVGEIPNNGPFVNFTAESFVHNSALCGATRFQVRRCLETHHQPWKYIVPSLVLVVLVIFTLLLVRRWNQKNVSVSSPQQIIDILQWRRISYIELVRGTSSFSENNLLGKGGFGSVFKATLVDGLDVAVKVFNLQSRRAVQSFEIESELLSQIRHRNIVHVIGCCTNIEFKALILEYMVNGSLEKWLYSNEECLDLIQRLRISIDVALALEYLHHGYEFHIVHCDVKPNNVLLDEHMIARVGDFGVAKLFDKGEDMIITQTLATIGYAAPEYGSEGKVSTNGDVYSYGIMLLEIFTGKKPTDDMFQGEISLKEWVNGALQENAISEVVDPKLLAKEHQQLMANEQSVMSVFNLAMKCLVTSPNKRINMIEAAATLKKIKAKHEVGLRVRYPH